MKSVTIPERHIRMLENADTDLKLEYITGIISTSKGEEPQASCPYMEDVFYSLVHGHTAKVIPGIPPFDSTGMKENDLKRYNQVQAGKVPSTGLDHSYENLNFKPITTLPKEYLEQLYSDCRDRISRKKGTAEYRKFIRYLKDVMKYCADSREL